MDAAAEFGHGINVRQMLSADVQRTLAWALAGRLLDMVMYTLQVSPLSVLWYVSSSLMESWGEEKHRDWKYKRTAFLETKARSSV